MGLRAAGFPIFGPWVWAGPGPETCRLGRAWAKYSWSGPGLGLNSSLRARPGPALKHYCGPGQGTSVCLRLGFHSRVGGSRGDSKCSIGTTDADWQS